MASSATGFDGTDGILGIGPVSLTQGEYLKLACTRIVGCADIDFPGTVSGVSSVPTVTDNLFSQGTISREVVSVSFQPTTQQEVTNGELTFGGTDSSKFTGSITYTPVTSTYPASQFVAFSRVAGVVV